MALMEGFVKAGAGGIQSSDISNVLSNASGIAGKLGGPLANMAGQARLLISMLGDWRAGRYRLPASTVSVLAFALLYVLMPFDLVPDFIPVAGLADDALVVTAALSMVGEDIRRYQGWLLRKRWQRRRARMRQQSKSQQQGV